MSNIFSGYSPQDPNKVWNSFSTPAKKTSNNTKLFYKKSQFVNFEDETRSDHYQSNQSSKNNDDAPKVKKLLPQQNKYYL